MRASCRHSFIVISKAKAQIVKMRSHVILLIYVPISQLSSSNNKIVNEGLRDTNCFDNCFCYSGKLSKVYVEITF